MIKNEFAEVNESTADSVANMYMEKYPEQMGAYESGSIISRVNESVSAFEMVAMGRQLDQFNNYQRYVNESFSGLSNLGAIPRIALDVITASVANSILPLVASTQPMAEEHGIIYYKQIRAQQQSGGYNKDDVIRDPRTRDNPGDGTLGSQRKQLSIGTGDGTKKDFAGTLPGKAVRPFTVYVNITNVGNGQDDGNGNILGFGFDGTINYATGAIAISTKTAVADGVTVDVRFDNDVDKLESLEKIQAGLQSKDIRAEIWTLAADIGTFSNFAFANRFGRSAEDETAQDLATEITNVLNTQAVKRIVGAHVGTHTWKQTPPDGVSYAEHKLTFVDALAASESNLHFNAGIGTAARIIAGRGAAAWLRGMPEFTRAASDAATSVGLYGFYDGIPVIRATGVVEDNKMYLLGNPDGYFNCPLGYSPFMPLMVTDTIQNPNNPFRGTKAAGVWAGMTVLNGNLVTELVIDSTPN